MTLRSLFAMMIALAVLFAPAVTSPAMATAAHQKMPTVEAGHCQTPASTAGHHDQKEGKDCCISLCMALAVVPTAPVEAPQACQQAADFAPPRSYHGLPEEIATPPPRHFRAFELSLH
jgi:hypothetical protein